MVITYGRSRPQVRVWIDELPEAAYEVTEIVEGTVRAEVLAFEVARSAGVEFYRVVGPRSIYGLLGATFSPHTFEQLTVQVALSAEDGPVYPDPLLRGGDIRVGFPYRDNATYVLEAALGASEIRALGSGIMRFDRAATSAIGSAQSLDARIARVVVRLLAGSVPHSDEDLRDLVSLLGTIG